VTGGDGIGRRRHFAVIGNPCDRPASLEEPFQSFAGRQTTTLSETAREVRCAGGVLEGATMSDHGYVIIGMFFDAVDVGGEDAPARVPDPTPGRMSSQSIQDKALYFHDEREWIDRCTDRAAHNYNSGMGEIFRKVSAISPITQEALRPFNPELPQPSGDSSCDASDQDIVQ